MTPLMSAATPSAVHVPLQSGFGSGIRYMTSPVTALPTRMPRVQSLCAGLTDPDSESAPYSTSFASMKIPLKRLN